MAKFNPQQCAQIREFATQQAARGAGGGDPEKVYRQMLAFFEHHGFAVFEDVRRKRDRLVQLYRGGQQADATARFHEWTKRSR